MKIKDLVESIREQEKEMLGKMPKAKIALIVRETLKAISEELEKSGLEKVRVPGLGNFVIKETKNSKDGKSEKRILLRRPSKK